VFVDRSGSADPAKALKPALDKLKNGISIVIAPEGQRSPGYKLGQFKKGAFHIAMQAGVPVVPIVIANASDALPKSAVVIRPATVEVSVLKPISTSDWNAESIDHHVANCRNLFLRKLGQVDDTD
jgi:putative phosphoserine phosphatase/1-acylglycerol-3-phosphate O-acyltransferase